MTLIHNITSYNFRVIRKLTMKLTRKNFKWTVGALSALHKGSESMLITLLEKVNLAAIHCQCITLMPKDIDLTIKLLDMMANYKTTVSVSGESLEEKKKNEEMRRKELDKMTRLKKRKYGKDSNSNPPVEPRSSGVGHIIDPISPLETDSSDDELVQFTQHNRKQKLSSLESDNSENEQTLFRQCSKKLDKSQFDYFTEMVSQMI